MIKIAVVDDEKHMREYILKCVKNITEKYNDIEIIPFADGEECIRAIEKDNTFQVFLLDIGMKGMTGIDCGKVIKKKCPESYIIFLTSYSEYAVASYVIEAYQYILKEDMEERLQDVLVKLMDQIQKKEKEYRLIGNTLNVQKLYLSDIIYIYKELGSKYIRYVTDQGEYRERISLDKLLKELDSKEFILVERGYLVNIKHIVSWKGNTLYLHDNQRVDISRDRSRQVKEYIHQYWRDKM